MRQSIVKVFFGLLATGLALGSDASHMASASHLASQARKAEKKGELSQAYLLYSRAATLQPRNARYRIKTAALVMPAPAVEPEEAPAPDFSTAFDPLTSFPRELLPPPQLQAKAGRVDIDLEGDAKTVFQQVTALFGLETVFDGDFEAGARRRLRLTQADYREAIEGAQAITGAFVVPLSTHLLMVAKDTNQKRLDLEQTMTVSVPLPQILQPQELIELAQGVRQVTGVEKLAWDSKSSTIVIRDRVSRVLQAQAVLRRLLSFRPQVVIEIQLIEIRQSDTTSYGIDLPSMFNVVYNEAQQTVTGALSGGTNNPFPFGSRSYSFLSLASQMAAGGVQGVYRGLFPNSLSLFRIGLGEAQTVANFSQSAGRLMLQAEIRATDSQASTFHLGDRYPIQTGSYSVGTSVQAQYVPPPAFTFEDLGTTFKITPHVHGMDDVSVDLESEFKVLTGQVVNGNPVISNRKLNASVRLRDDEWGVVAGLVQKSDSKTDTGTAGISQIPLLGRLFRKHTRQKDESQVLVLMKPRLLSLPGNETVGREMRVGSDLRPYLPL